MSDNAQIPFDADVATFANWLSRNFKGMPRNMRSPVELADAFQTLQGRGNTRTEWFDVLWLKVRALRADGTTWNEAAKKAVEEWNELDVMLPKYLHNVSDSSLQSLIQQLKNRKASVAELGLHRVTVAHFYVAFAYGEFDISAQLHHAANNILRKDIQSFIRGLRVN